MNVENSNNTGYRNEKDYMSSFQWNYLVLELVDFIEIKLKDATATTEQRGKNHKWRYFMEFCAERGLNRRVIKKMIEFSVSQAFDCEADLANHEKFRSLKIGDSKTMLTTANGDAKITTTAKNAPIPGADLNFDSIDFDFN
jgi:hypothetical protein